MPGLSAAVPSCSESHLCMLGNLNGSDYTCLPYLLDHGYLPYRITNA